MNRIAKIWCRLFGHDWMIFNPRRTDFNGDWYIERTHFCQRCGIAVEGGKEGG